MIRYHIRIPPDVEHSVQHLHPKIKAKIRAALEDIETNPYTGKPLRENLKGFWSYRVSQYRIVYRIKKEIIVVEVIDIAKRTIVYENVAHLLRKKHPVH